MFVMLLYGDLLPHGPTSDECVVHLVSSEQGYNDQLLVRDPIQSLSSAMGSVGFQHDHHW